MGDSGTTQGEPNLSRRTFLAGATAAAAGMAATAGRGLLARTPPAQRGARPDRSLVVQARSEHIVEGRVVQEHMLKEMLDWCLTRLTRTSTPKEAWRQFLRPDDVIGLKFNRSGAAGLGTTPAFVEALVRCLADAGWAPQNIVPIEVPETVYGSTGTTRPSTDWDDEEVDFGSGRDRLSSVLRQITALINVPFLKTHNITGMTGCLKNLSHALVKHPARFHDNNCCPYIGDIVALPQIRDKLKLNIVNALRLVFDGGPEARDDLTWESGIVIAGFDPVAVDTVGLELLNRTRKSLRLPYVDRRQGKVAYLGAASERGLGCSRLHRIEVAKRLLQA
ncbi:MAG: DUF362 domain-containing protein [Phycisphaerales bacterium]|nr:MAG: DUF362 domain-containing protein [Phycisphaerales bacterium]